MTWDFIPIIIKYKTHFHWLGNLNTNQPSILHSSLHPPLVQARVVHLDASPDILANLVEHWQSVDIMIISMILSELTFTGYFQESGAT